MAKIKPTACSNCGRTDRSVTTFVHATSGAKHYMCALCQVESDPNGKKQDIASLDASIKEYTEMAQMYSELILSMPKEMQEMQEMTGGSNLMMTPMSAFRDIQMMIAHFTAKRLEAAVAESATDNEAFLNAELTKAVAAEDFEKATEIRNRLAELKK